MRSVRTAGNKNAPRRGGPGVAWWEYRRTRGGVICACAVDGRAKPRETVEMAAEGENSIYPIAVLIDELRNDDVQVRDFFSIEDEEGVRWYFLLVPIHCY